MAGKNDMPEPLATVYEAVWQEVAGLSFAWKLYRDLYANETALKVINKTATGAFQTIERALRTEIVMAISRLVDQPAFKHRTNLSLAHLIEITRPHVDPPFIQRLEGLLASIHDRLQPMKLHRNRKIGHCDRPATLEPNVEPIPRITREMVTDAAVQITEFLDTVSVRFNGGNTMFDDPISTGDGKALVFYLNAARQHFEDKKRADLARFGRNLPKAQMLRISDD